MIPKSHVDKLCTAKHDYSSKKHAEARIKAARKSGRIVSPSLAVYKCNFCACWHIGHKKEFEIR